MKLFDKEIDLQQSGCSVPNHTPRVCQPYVNLYIKITNGCNAQCAFCCNAGHQSGVTFSMSKLIECIEEINRTRIRLHRICLTGGEPSLNPNIVKEILDYIKTSHQCNASQVQINTNGLTQESLKMIRHPRLNVVSVSMHHYDKEKLGQIYGIDISKAAYFYKNLISQKLNVSCNLIRGYIDSPKEVEKYLQFVASKGIRTVGFVGLMKLNEYCREHFVDFSEIDWNAIPQLHKINEREHLNHCKCRNYVYDSPHGLVNVYMRETLNPDYCGSSLLFDGEHLRQGFSSNNIIY